MPIDAFHGCVTDSVAETLPSRFMPGSAPEPVRLARPVSAILTDLAVDAEMQGRA